MADTLRELARDLRLTELELEARRPPCPTAEQRRNGARPEGPPGRRPRLSPALVPLLVQGGQQGAHHARVELGAGVL